MAEFTTAGAADRTHLAYGVGGEVVVEHELLRILLDETVDPLLVPASAQRDGDERLRLAPLKQGRAMHPREQVDFAVELPQRRVVAAVRPLALQDQFADRPLLQPVPDVGEVGIAGAAGRPRLEPEGRLRGGHGSLRLLLQRLHGLAAILLDHDRLGGLQLAEVVTSQAIAEGRVVGEHVFLLRLARLADELLLHFADHANDAMGFLQRLEHPVLGHLAGEALDHEHRGRTAGDDEVEITLFELVDRRKRHKPAVDLGDTHAPDRTLKGQR